MRCRKMDQLFILRFTVVTHKMPDSPRRLRLRGDMWIKKTSFPRVNGNISSLGGSKRRSGNE